MERRNNIEKAITRYHAALQVFTYESNPTKYATIHMNLGIAYAGRIAGVRWENQEQAISRFRASFCERFPPIHLLKKKQLLWVTWGMAMSVAP